jgi:Bacteriophage Lambda NinG protein
MPICRHHKTKFEAKYFNQKYCLSDDECIKAFNEWVKSEKQKQYDKKAKVEKKQLKEKLKTKSDYEKELQKEINTIVRLVDKGSVCHSTLNPLNDKFDAGHFFSCGSNPSIRFNLMNIYSQSVYANQYLSGDQINFMNGLEEIYGTEHKDLVMSLKSKYPILKLAIQELKEKIAIAREIVRELKAINLTYSPKVRLELRRKYNEILGIYK